jgi:tRNA(Ile)-lysidine synthase
VAALPEAVAAVRLAVRGTLTDVRRAGATAPVLVACSGGADSMALAAATAFLAPRVGVPAGLFTVDHGLQPGSTDRAERVARWAEAVGLSPVRVLPVRVGTDGGPEAAARTARYRALADAARAAGATAVLLGHSRDDQAETVLLALARGSGPRGLAGMPPAREIHGVTFLRPLLGVSRATLREACAESDLPVWDDPHNSDPAYSRSRVRAALPVLVEALGRDVVDNLARTARLLGEDTALLDELAERAGEQARAEGGALRVPVLRDLPAALRTRVLRRFALDRGATPGALSLRHVDALDALVTRWHGQGAVALPGGYRVRRRGDLLLPDGGDPLVPGDGDGDPVVPGDGDPLVPGDGDPLVPDGGDPPVPGGGDGAGGYRRAGVPPGQ